MPPDDLPGLDLDRLRGLLDGERPGLVHGPLTGRLIEGGRSNLTYAVTDGTTKWVVRRPRSAMSWPPRTTCGASTG